LAIISSVFSGGYSRRTFFVSLSMILIVTRFVSSCIPNIASELCLFLLISSTAFLSCALTAVPSADSVPSLAPVVSYMISSRIRLAALI
jgi:hypothetical protein